MPKENNEELENESLENMELDKTTLEKEAEEKAEAEAKAEADEKAVENEINLLQEEIASLKDKYARVHADFDNIKKRLEREKYTAVEYSNEKFAKDMIPVMDALQMALSSTQNVADPQEHLEKLQEGIELTLKQLTASLQKHGVTMVSHDEPFDPNIHNAIQSVDSDTVESGQIVQTLQTGYRYKERPLREAMVVVAN